MSLNLIDKNVFITGSSKGIGLEIAKFFCEHDAKVVINSRHLSDCEAVTSEIGCAGFSCGDMSDEKEANLAVKNAVNILGQLDILVCNVGSGVSVPPGEETMFDWQDMFNKNFFSTVLSIEHSREYLSRTGGVIICISSICGHEIIKGAPLTYSASKAALNHYIKGISWPLSKENIRINGVSPGNIIFDGSAWERKLEKQMKETQDMLNNNVPMNRFGTSSEVASVVGFLSSPESSFMTGSVIIVDGGQTRN
jgi:NAD(P)-dependent dehydrogenase (short-subunit alcohol dehydrogenase family)